MDNEKSAQNSVDLFLNMTEYYNYNRKSSSI